MATASTQLLTAEEFYAFVHRPENEGRFFELEEAVVVEMPPPFRGHGRICPNLSALLHDYCKLRRAGEVVSNDSGIIVARSPDTVRAPDVVLYKEAMKYEDLPEHYAEEMPLPPIAKDGDEIANLPEMPGFVCRVQDILDSPGA
jgi:Uma2 family endonuclease